MICPQCGRRLIPFWEGSPAGGALAALGASYRVGLRVLEVDEKTETLQVAIDGDDLDFDRISETISESGASLHSIDEVSVFGE